MKKIYLGKTFFALAIVLGIIFVAGLVKAEDNDTAALKGQALDVRFSHLTCQVDFTNKQIDILNKYMPEASITDNLTLNKGKLTDDMSQLSTIKGEGNKTAFDDFLQTTLKPDFKDANDAIKEAKKEVKDMNLSNDSKASMKTELKNAIAAYADCTSDKEMKMAQILLKNYQNSDKNWQRIITLMNQRNLSTENLTAIDQELQSWIQKLQDAINTGNKTTIQQTIQDIHSQELHLWANFNIDRLEAYGDKIYNIAERFNMTGNISYMRHNLDGLNQYTMPGHKYTDGEYAQVWDTIKNEGKDLSQISKDLLNKGKAQIQDNRRQLQQARMDNRTLNRTMPPRGNGSGPRDRFNRTRGNGSGNGSEGG